MADAESLHLVDLSAIEELDPSLADGASIIYDREVPIEVRNQVGDEPIRQGVTETIKVKLLVVGSEQDPSKVRIELSSEADLFFHYVHNIDEEGFRRIQEQQKLMISFSEYSHVLIRMLNACIKETHTHMAILLMYGESLARLDFIQNMEYKFVDLLSCAFERSPDEIVQHHITYRYNTLKQKLAIMQARLHDINSLVKTKNPSLLLQLQKYTASPGDASSSGNGARVHGGSGSSVLNTSTIWR